MFLRNPTVKKDSIQIVYKDKTGEITSLSFDFESISRITEPGKHIPKEQAKKKAMEHIQKLYGPVDSQYQVLKVMPIEYPKETVTDPDTGITSVNEYSFTYCVIFQKKQTKHPNEYSMDMQMDGYGNLKTLKVFLSRKLFVNSL